MNIVDRLKVFLGVKRPDPESTELIYVYLPMPLEPIEREDRFGDPIDAELRLDGVGYVSGGGSQLGANDPDGKATIVFCGIDVEATDVCAALDLLRRQLPALGCAPGTQLHYQQGSARLQDDFDGTVWVNGLPRDMLHPGFGV